MNSPTDGRMDSRRIMLHLIKSVVKPELFSPLTTYVVEFKWVLVRKRDVDDFLNVLRWSRDFKVDTPGGL